MKKAIQPAIFKWRQTEPELILCAVRWSLRYSLSLHDVEELLNERGTASDPGIRGHAHDPEGAGEGVSGSDVRQQIQFINMLFQVAA